HQDDRHGEGGLEGEQEVEKQEGEAVPVPQEADDVQHQPERQQHRLEDYEGPAADHAAEVLGDALPAGGPAVDLLVEVAYRRVLVSVPDEGAGDVVEFAGHGHRPEAYRPASNPKNRRIPG